MSQQAQGGAGGEGQDQEILKLAVIAVIVFFLIMILIRMQEERANAVIGAVAYLHVAAIAELVRFAPFLLDVPFFGNWLFRSAAQTHDYLYDGGYAYMSPQARSLVLTYSGRCALLFYGPFLLWIAFKGFDFRVDHRFRTPHTLESLIWAQSETWTTSRTARHNNPLKTGEISVRSIAAAASARIATLVATPMPGKALPRKVLALAPDTWNRSMRPEEWLISKGLLFDDEAYARLTSKSIMPVEADFGFRSKWGEIQLQSVSETLAQQLRDPWLGAAKLRPCHRALFAVMALFYSYDVDRGNKLLGELALISDAVKTKKGRMDAALVAEKELMARIDAIATGDLGIKLSNLASHHAWVESAFPTFLTMARKDRGVLPSPAFLWLKAEDRLMWYILNSIGNAAIMVEAAGAVAHWRAETQIGRAIRRPAVYQASRDMIEGYLDQTQERIEVRKNREIRKRMPGAQIDMNLSQTINARSAKKDVDGIDEE